LAGISRATKGTPFQAEQLSDRFWPYGGPPPMQRSRSASRGRMARVGAASIGGVRRPPTRSSPASPMISSPVRASEPCRIRRKQSPAMGITRAYRRLVGGAASIVPTSILADNWQVPWDDERKSAQALSFVEYDTFAPVNILLDDRRTSSSRSTKAPVAMFARCPVRTANNLFKKAQENGGAFNPEKGMREDARQWPTSLTGY